MAAVAFPSPEALTLGLSRPSAPTVSGAPGAWPEPPRLLSRIGSPQRFYSGQFTELYNYPVRGAEKRCLHLQEGKLRLLGGDPSQGAKLGRDQTRFSNPSLPRCSPPQTRPGRGTGVPQGLFPSHRWQGAADKLIHAIFTLCIMLHDFILLHSRNLLQ